MLVIRRRAGESFLIGDEVEVEILEVGETQVKLGIRAPKQIAIMRKEIHLTAAQNQIAASELAPARIRELLASWRTK